MPISFSLTLKKLFRQAVSIKLIPMPVAAILLAAGASLRLGQPKQLLELDGEPLVERALRLASEAGAAPLIAVLGAHPEKVWAAVRTRGVLPVLNAAWNQGIASSIHAGLQAAEGLGGAISGAMILTCDQPQLTAEHLRTLLESFDQQPSPCCIASSYAGIRGIPAVFPRSAFADLYALRGDQGARALFRDPTRAVIAVSFPGGEVDIDLPSDLVKLASRALESKARE